MKSVSRMKAVAAAMAVLVFAGGLRAADPAPTNLTVPGLDCMVCANKAGTKLYEVPGVADVKVDLKAKLLIVTPKQGATVSPRTLWEGVEKAGYEPSRLQGPGGTFTAKPKS